MEKIYRLTHIDYDWETTIGIDEEFIVSESEGNKTTTKDIIKGMVEFWSGWENRLADNDGDYTKTFLQQLSREVLYQLFQHPRSTLKGIIYEFEDLEGWWAPDGSAGFQLLEIDPIEIEHERFEVKEVANG